jgi:dTDP-4-amino-4,6-dideoxygalactose transaminase
MPGRKPKPSQTQAPTVVPYNRPSIGEEEIEEVVGVLRSGWLTTGAKVKLFEDQFKEYVGARNAVAVSSCTAGLEVYLVALGVGPGDEVIVPTLTFAATANVALHLGARVVLVDVDEDAQVLPSDVEEAITKETRAILPVHYAGQACSLDAIRGIAAERGIAVIEDAAHAPGCEWNGGKIGRDGTAVFSFYATKNMTTGEGGMIVTEDDEIVPKLRRIALQGISSDSWARYHEGSWAYEVVEPGFKANMTDIEAALGIHQLRRLEGFMKRRREIAARYNAAFADLEMELPGDLPGRPHGYHLYPVRLPLEVDRSRFIAGMERRGVGTSVHFIPLHRMPVFAGQYRPSQFPRTERIWQRLVSLPLYPAMTDDQVEYVIDQVRAELVADQWSSAL